MVVLKNLALSLSLSFSLSLYLSENLALPAPLRIQSPPQLLKSSSQSHIFSALLICPEEAVGEGVHGL